MSEDRTVKSASQPAYTDKSFFFILELRARGAVRIRPRWGAFFVYHRHKVEPVEIVRHGHRVALPSGITVLVLQFYPVARLYNRVEDFAGVYLFYIVSARDE